MAKKLLELFGIQKYCTDGWGAYERYLLLDQHEIEKALKILKQALVSLLNNLPSIFDSFNGLNR